ncbi:hypothetical protein [Stappia sp.]|uniref:hypothetical protein n=1 Tax=Stappia sp. TaxID=1870903 RepID=UPI003D0CBFAE
MMIEAARNRIGWHSTAMRHEREGESDLFTVASSQKPAATIIGGVPVVLLGGATATYVTAHADVVALLMLGLVGYMLFELVRVNFRVVLLRLGREVEAASMLVLPGIGTVPLGPTRKWPLNALSRVSTLQTEYGKAKTKPVDWPGYGLEVKIGEAAAQRLVSGVTLEQAETLRGAILARMEREEGTP